MSNVEDFLGAALHSARTDPTWAVTPQRVDLDSVRRGAHAHRRRVRIVTLTGTGLALLLGIGLTAVTLGSTDSDTLRPAAPPVTAPAAPPTAVLSVTPAWRPTSARDWVLPHEQYLAFTATHHVEHPTTPPAQVASPAPLTPLTAALEVRTRAGLPAGSSLDRDDAPAGEPGVAALHVRLPDGTPIEVQQRQLTEPQDESDGPAVAQVPGTQDLYSATASSTGYAFPGQRQDGIHAVYVFDAQGRVTTWYAPTTVPLKALTGWALAATASK